MSSKVQDEQLEVKPTTFARGVPKAEKNGLYGIERQLIANPERPVVAVVTYGVDDVIEKRVKGEMYPVVRALHIEPLHDEKAVEAALELQRKAREARGDVELPMPEEPEPDFETELGAEEPGA